MLTVTEIKAAEPKAKAYKLHDTGGLFLLVLPSGTKSWRQKYRFGGKEKQLTHGRFPSLSLKDAREARDEARRQLEQGVDPARKSQVARAKRAGTYTGPTTVKQAALRWHSLQSHGWKPRHAEDVKNALEREVFPVIGDRPIAEVATADIRPIIDAMQDRGAVDQAHRMLMRLSRIWQLAIVDEIATMDPAAPLTAILMPVPKRKYRALITLPECRSALQAFEQERHWPETKLASRLLALTAARPGPVRFAQASEFFDLDGEDPRWIIPAEKMKLERAEAEQENFAFQIPLARQTVELVKVAIANCDGRPYLFSSIQFAHKPVSENALSTAYRRSPLFGGRHVPHGWRSSFSTIMNERAADLDRPGDRAVIDLMLGHKPEGVEAHYNRAAYMARRRLIAQEWADLLTPGLMPPEQLLEGPRN